MNPAQFAFAVAAAFSLAALGFLFVEWPLATLMAGVAAIGFGIMGLLAAHGKAESK